MHTKGLFFLILGGTGKGGGVSLKIKSPGMTLFQGLYLPQNKFKIVNLNICETELII